MSTLAMKMFLGAPIELDPPLVSSKWLLGLAGRFLIFTAILLIAVVFWGAVAWCVEQVPAIIASYQAVYVEGMDPVLPEYYAGWGR